jgi:hypothetical protein
MTYPDRQHLTFDEKVQILEEKVTVKKSVFVTANNTDVRKMIEIAKTQYAPTSEAFKAVAALIERLEKAGKIGGTLAFAYKSLLHMGKAETRL